MPRKGEHRLVIYSSLTGPPDQETTHYVSELSECCTIVPVLVTHPRHGIVYGVTTNATADGVPMRFSLQVRRLRHAGEWLCTPFRIERTLYLVYRSRSSLKYRSYVARTPKGYDPLKTAQT